MACRMRYFISLYSNRRAWTGQALSHQLDRSFRVSTSVEFAADGLGGAQGESVPSLLVHQQPAELLLRIIPVPRFVETAISIMLDVVDRARGPCRDDRLGE